MSARDVLRFTLGAFVACGLVYIAADPAAAIIGVLVVASFIVAFLVIGWMAGAAL